jgi:hypothetical protein
MPQELTNGAAALAVHWLWKLLCDIVHFGPLHIVFTKIEGTTPKCRTDSWTQIFTHYPVAGTAITHKLLARGLKRCLSFKENSTTASTAYITVIKELPLSFVT